MPSEPHIGTLREKPLHASLKQWYSTPTDRVEWPVESFVIDLVRADLLIEIQTRGFSSMKQKVATLLERGHRIRIVYPIPVDKWIVKIDGEGTVIDRRRSPKHGHPTDLFAELVSFPDLFLSPALEIELLLITEEELRRHSPGQAWRRNGWVVVERRLIEVTESILFSQCHDLVGLLPAGLPQTFTTTDLAEQTGRPRRTAQQMAYCLRKIGLVNVVGKRGNSIEYQLALSP